MRVAETLTDQPAAVPKEQLAAALWQKLVQRLSIFQVQVNIVDGFYYTLIGVEIDDQVFYCE